VRSRRIFLALLIVAGAALALTAAAPATAAPAGIAKKKKKCKGNKIPVKSKGKTRCKKLSKVLPAPQEGDTRLAYLQQAVTVDAGKNGGKSVRRFEKKARRVILRALPQALELADSLQRKQRHRGEGRRAEAAASAGCGGQSSGAQVTTPVGDAGGATIQGTLRGNTPGGVIEYSANGFTSRTTFRTCGNPYLYVPKCPSASGDVSASANSGVESTQEVFKGGELVSTHRFSNRVETRARGKVADDALLDYIDVDSTERTEMTSSPGGSRSGTANRRVRVNMRTGSYDPASSSVTINGNSGVFDEGSFARLIANAITDFRAAERGGDFLHDDGWSNFNRTRDPYCVTPEFNPRTNTLRLRPGQSRRVSMYAKTQDGAKAVAARWSVVEQRLASFSPTSVRDPEPSIDYRVVNSAPPNSRVRMTAKVTSTAGVGKATWTQTIEDVVPPPTRFQGPISGTADYDQNELGEGNSLDASWGGGVNLVRTQSPIPPGFPGAPYGVYKIAAGSSIHYNYSGQVGDCHVAGSGPIDLSSQVDLANGHVLLIYAGNPRRYQLVIPMPVLVQIVGTQSDCEDPNENGEDFEWAPAAGIPLIVNAPLPGGPVSQQNWNIAGTRSGNNGGGTPDQTWQWNLTPIQ
jgi:hypothetical protein